MRGSAVDYYGGPSWSLDNKLYNCRWPTLLWLLACKYWHTVTTLSDDQTILVQKHMARANSVEWICKFCLDFGKKYLTLNGKILSKIPIDLTQTQIFFHIFFSFLQELKEFLQYFRITNHSSKICFISSSPKLMLLATANKIKFCHFFPSSVSFIHVSLNVFLQLE